MYTVSFIGVTVYIIIQFKMAGRSTALLCLLIVCISGCVTGTENSQPVVDAKFGKVYGKSVTLDVNDDYFPEAKTVDVYQSIPYAESPVGSLRFKPPVAKTWDNDALFNATGPRVACVQELTPFFPVLEEQNEDCLHLDVYTPNPKPEKAPVMVFIHGGGLAIGIGTSSNMSQVPMVALGNVVAININYRLNVFGFFFTGDDVVPGNMGLKDQTLALQWVRDNIAEFGGDPDMVTIYGESAGSFSVATHIVSPMSKGLFHRGIMQSGTVMESLKSESKAVQRSRAFAFGRSLGCDQSNTDKLVQCLQAVDSQTLVANCSINTAVENGENPSTLMFVPNADGEFLPDDPNKLYDDRNAINDVDIMLGTLSDEGSIFVKHSIVGGVANRTFYDNYFVEMAWMGLKYDLEKNLLKYVYVSDELLANPDSDYYYSIYQMVGDLIFVCPTEKTARQLVTAGKENVYLYKMTHVPSRSFWSLLGMEDVGAAHGDDLPFVFGMHYNEENSWFYGKLPAEEVRLTNAMMTYWSNFAKTGDPNNSGGDSNLVLAYPKWPKFTLAEHSYKDISTTMQNSNALNFKRCAFINDILPKARKLEEKLEMFEKSKYSCESVSCDEENP
ncbi:acetylcholinesterase-like [Antedon mediterranea]|uniref:acetylcholinesterase-like n=1 Tax=Antedon mediterranea TaxID=105859 RepID=UPI003AF45270